MLNLKSVMIGSSNPKELAKFYEMLIGKPAEYAEDDWFGWHLDGLSLNIGFHSEVESGAKDPKRLILNFETSDVKAEFERLKTGGAIVIAKPYEMEEGNGGWIATMADIDGNYFQLMSPWE